MSYVLSCSSTADLSRAHMEARDIHYVCFHYYLNDKEYPDDLGQSIPFPDFYKAMREGADTRTSQINISEYLDYFEGFLSQGLDVLHVTLSTGISGTYNSAMDAANICRERYPERKLYIVDSLGASSGYGLLMDTLADQRDAGLDIDALRDWAEEHKLNLHHWFFSTDLSFYVKGGRISRAAGIFGGMLNICPLLNMDDLGRLIPRSKLRGKARVIREIVERMAQHARDGENYDGKVYISQSACMEDARAVADLVEARFPKMNGKVEINHIGTTIGSHTGPGTVALFFWGDKRVR
ncbi:MAG: DegV family protein [Oscillospiraceae bacterium]|nr:DegV family protein [Oscillospiraceae bacterium]